MPAVQPESQTLHLHAKGTDRVLAAIAKCNGEAADPRNQNWFEVVDAEDDRDLTGAHWTQAWAAWRLALAEYAAGLIGHTKVDVAADRLDKVVTNLARQVRGARAEAQRLFDAPRPERRDHLVGDSLPNPFGQQPRYRSAANVPLFIGTHPRGDESPLVSIGPSGIGGYAQREVLDESGASAGVGVAEIDSAIAPVGVTCGECDTTIAAGSVCTRCANGEGVERE